MHPAQRGQYDLIRSAALCVTCLPALCLPGRAEYREYYRSRYSYRGLPETDEEKGSESGGESGDEAADEEMADCPREGTTGQGEPMQEGKRFSSWLV